MRWKKERRKLRKLKTRRKKLKKDRLEISKNMNKMMRKARLSDLKKIERVCNDVFVFACC